LAGVFYFFGGASLGGVNVGVEVPLVPHTEHSPTATTSVEVTEASVKTATDTIATLTKAEQKAFVKKFTEI
jgi:hypothetical protein